MAIEAYSILYLWYFAFLVLVLRHSQFSQCRVCHTKLWFLMHLSNADCPVCMRSTLIFWLQKADYNQLNHSNPNRQSPSSMFISVEGVEFVVHVLCYVLAKIFFHPFSSLEKKARQFARYQWTFGAEQVTFHSYLPDEQEPVMVVLRLNR